MIPTLNCEHCNTPLKPAPAKLRADGEQTYCGFIPCACKKQIFTDYGVIYPGEPEHTELLKSGRYNINNIF